jgi:hypothetical protein
MLRLGMLALIGLAAVAVGIAAAGLTSGASRQAAATTGPSFSMEVLGSACHPSSAGANCDIDPFADFTLGVQLTKTNLPDYRGFQVKLTSPDELPYLNRPGQEEIVWPDCDIAYDVLISAATYQVGCTRFDAQPASTYLGPVVEVDYRCVASSSMIYTITMPQGAFGDNTYLVDSTYHIVDPEGGPSKTLTLRCFGTAPSPTATLSPTVTPSSTPQPSATPTNTPSPSPTATPTPQRVAGDVNCHGRVDAIDAALVLQLSAGLIGALSCEQNGDVNHDSSVDAIDAALILQYVAGLVSHL